MHEQLIALARAAIPAECVGLLGGVPGSARAAIPLPNIASDSMAFLADPRAQFLAERQLAAAGLRLVAIYHSHPGGGPALSDADRACAANWPHVLQVVIAVARPAGHPDELRAYRPDGVPVPIMTVGQTSLEVGCQAARSRSRCGQAVARS